MVFLHAYNCTSQLYFLYTFKNNNYDVVKDFPPIRVWGTIGFIVAMWITNLSGNKASEFQFYIAGAAAVLLGLYSFCITSL